MSTFTPTPDRAAIRGALALLRSRGARNNSRASSFCDRYVERFGREQHPDRAVTLTQARRVLVGIPSQLIPVERRKDRGRTGRHRIVKLISFRTLAKLCELLDETQESEP